MASAVLAVDQGTTNTKAVLLDRSGAMLGQASAPVGVTFPGPGRVEQDPEQIWRSVLEAIAGALAAAPDGAPVAIALANQRESVVAWDRRSGLPLGPAIGWQDSRTPECWSALVAAGAEHVVGDRTGLRLDPMFSAGKMRRLLDGIAAEGSAAPGDIAIGTVDSWLIWRLTGGEVHACDAGNASRTLLFDLGSLDWHDELLSMFGVPRAALPEVRPSNAGFGATADLGVLASGVPVAAVLADSHAALFGHGCTDPGTAKATYGTGSSVMTPCASPDAAPAGISTTLAWLTDRPVYAREANVLATGAALDWISGVLRVDGVGELGALAATVPDTAGAHFVPAFSGLGAPYWDRSAVGAVTGVTAGTSAAHLARAAFEGVAHQIADVVAAIESGGEPRIDEIRADGGATASPALMQIQADVLGRAVRVGEHAEVSAVGAARMAWSALGHDTRSAGEVDVAPTTGGDTTFTPAGSVQEREERRAQWQAAVARSRGIAVPR